MKAAYRKTVRGVWAADATPLRRPGKRESRHMKQAGAFLGEQEVMP